MAYVVRVNGVDLGRFDTEEQAVACVRRLIQEQPDAEPEILDSETRKAVAPGSSRGWREKLANEVGY